MKIAVVQFDTIWEDKTHNLAFVKNEVLKLPEDVELIVLPEMFTTGFTMNADKVFENEHGETLQFVQDLAILKQSAITASWVVKEREAFYNRLFFVYPDGSYKTYNKRHLFTLAGEHLVFTPGDDKLFVSYKGFNICLLVCYDLRFPVYSRIVNENYDLLVYIASWPDRRIEAWNCLLKARAIENMSYVVGVNRCGVDPNGVAYSGCSQVIDFMGQYLISPIIGQQSDIVSLDVEALHNTRAKFSFLSDADLFHID